MLFHIFYASASITDESTIFITLSGHIHPRIFPPSEEKRQSGQALDWSIESADDADTAPQPSHIGI